MTKYIPVKKVKAKVLKKVKPKHAKPILTKTIIREPTNHIQTADSYAFKTIDIRQKMKGPLNPNKPKIVFLTFDDGPSTNNTPKVLKILAQNNVHATFFLVGNRITAQSQNLVKQAYQNGNGIGIHSFTHDYKILYPNNVPNAQTILNEALQTRTLLKSVLGPNFNTGVWRYPGGTMSWKNLAVSENLLQKNGFNWMDWNAADGDGMGLRAPKSVQDAMSYHAMSITVYPQSNVEVVLMHDSDDKDVTVATLPELIKYYKTRGYQFGILE
ncbi:hypothetical protein KIMC2_01620 [Xylocopilactobacillus apis]|uniref:NodB homology domain-containing protein n=2 Tax=Xylocopilactobacillus apis TaxID=2932183 RepID=A0AAU9D2I5_9LACO|nr:hypothetical protein KIMC2_01620 [Xylocopilactobacillus apis]